MEALDAAQNGAARDVKRPGGLSRGDSPFKVVTENISGFTHRHLFLGHWASFRGAPKGTSEKPAINRCYLMCTLNPFRSVRSPVPGHRSPIPLPSLETIQ